MCPRILTARHIDHHVALEQARQRQKTDDFRKDYPNVQGLKQRYYGGYLVSTPNNHICSHVALALYGVSHNVTNREESLFLARPIQEGILRYAARSNSNAVVALHSDVSRATTTFETRKQTAYAFCAACTKAAKRRWLSASVYCKSSGCHCTLMTKRWVGSSLASITLSSARAVTTKFCAGCLTA